MKEVHKMNFIKRNLQKIMIAFVLMFTFTFSLFGVVNTYAFSIDNNGNLVGNNLFDINGLYSYKSDSIIISQQNEIICSSNIYGNAQFIIYSSIYNSGTYTIKLNVNDNIVDSASNKYRLLCSNGAFGTQLEFYNNFYYIDLNSDTPFTFTSNSSFQLGFVFISQSNNNSQVKIYEQIMLNLGNTSLSWEPYGVWYSSNNYNDLLNRFNSLISNVNPFDSNILSQNIYFNNNLYTPYSDYDYVFVPQNREIVVDSSGLRDIYDGIFNSSSGNVRYEIIFNNPFSVFSIVGEVDTLFNIDFDLYGVDDNLLFSVSYNSTSGDLANGIFDMGVVFGIKKIVISADITDDSSGRDNSYIDFGSSYADGYNNGLNASNTYWKQQYDKIAYQYNTTINDLQDRLNITKHNLDNLTIAFNDLQQSYNNMLNGNNFANLFFTIAETPFSSFKQIWSVDFLGVNLAGFVTGVLFIGLLIWIVKKIF